MEKLVVEITDESKVGFVKELLGSFDYIRIKKSSKKTKDAEVTNRVEELREAFKEVEQHSQGKKKLKSLDQVLNEL